MKILTITTSFPYPPDDGTKIQVYERVRALSARHDLTLLCTTGSESISTDRIEAMERFCNCIFIGGAAPNEPATAAAKVYQMIRSVMLLKPYYVHDRISREAQMWLSREMTRRHFDVIEADGDAHVYLLSAPESLRVAIFHSVAETCARREIALAGTLAQKTAKVLYKGLNRCYEAKVVGAADLCVTLTENNCRGLQRLYPLARVRHCLSNGVDTDYFEYRAPIEPPTGVCFVGKLDYMPNVDAVLWFSRTVLPLVRDKLPEFRFVIIGSRPAAAIKDLAKDTRNTVTGYVGDVRPHMRDAGLMALPMRMGGGILNKLLQGLAMGVPIIATSHSLDGLFVTANQHLIIADSPDEIAAGIVHLATDRALRERLAQAGREYVRAAHQWEGMVRRYEVEVSCCLAERNGVPRCVAKGGLAHL